MSLLYVSTLTIVSCDATTSRNKDAKLIVMLRGFSWCMGMSFGGGMNLVGLSINLLSGSLHSLLRPLPSHRLSRHRQAHVERYSRQIHEKLPGERLPKNHFDSPRS